MIKSKCYKLVMLVAFVSLIGCNSKSADSVQASDNDSKNETSSILDVIENP